MDKLIEAEAKCAHKRVVHRPMPIEGGLWTDRWYCDLCRCEFTPLAVRRSHCDAGTDEGLRKALAEGLSWALDLLDMYDKKLIEMGEPAELVYAPIHLAGKEKARKTLQASHAAESAPVSSAPECCPHKDKDHVLTAYRRYCKHCSCETKECSCKSWRGINDDCPMHREGRLKAQDEPTLAEKVHAVMTAGVKDVGVDHFYGKSPVAQLDAEAPAEPVEDVAAQHNQHWNNPDTGQTECECCCGWALDMEAVLKIIDSYGSEGGEPDRKEYPADTCQELLARIRARLAPKPEPSQSAVIDTLRSEDFQRANACIECGTLVVHQELHAKWHAALVDRRTK